MRSKAEVGAAFALYTVVTFCVIGWPFGPASAVMGYGDDPKVFVWFLAWWPWAILHGQDPFWSHLVFAPKGYSMAWATSVPTASLMALPWTLTAGPVAAFNVLTAFAHPTAATAMFVLMRTLTRRLAASIVAGFLYGFSGFEDGQVLGHLNLDLDFLFPLMVLAVLLRYRNRTGPGRFVASLSILLTLQLGLSSEMFALAIVCGLAVFLMYASDADAAERRTLRRTFIESAAAAIIAAVVFLPMLASMARGAAEMPGFVNPPDLYSNDLANLVVPSKAEWLRSRWSDSVAARFSGNAEEQDLYLGLPLCLIVVLFACGRARRYRFGLLTTLVILLAASLGPSLRFVGHRILTPMPWALATHLPLLKGALPCRIGAFVGLVAALVAGVWIAEGSRRRLALGITACVFLLPGPAARTRTSFTRPCLFSPGAATASFAPNTTILLLPYGAGDPMVWQALSGMRFAQTGGLMSFVPRDEAAGPLVLPLLTGVPPGDLETELLAYARKRHLSAVVAGPGTSDQWRRALASLPWPHHVACSVTILSVP
jgi:hypothetical protein